MSNLRHPCRPSAALSVVQVLQIFFVLAALLCLAACDGNNLVWSSDGKLGAVVGAKGLRICDGDGAISPILEPRAGLFRWIPQEHKGLVVAYDYVKNWSELKPLLSKEQEQEIAAETVKLRHKIFAYHGDPKKFPDSALRTFNYPLEAAMQLHAQGPLESDKMAAHKWPGYASIRVPVFQIRTITVDAQQVKPLTIVDRGLDEIVELRVSPNGKFVACVKHARAQEQNYMVVLPLSASGKVNAPALAYNTNSYPDWSADSRTIYFTRANNDGEPDLLKGHGVHEGGLFKAEATDVSGKLLNAMKTQRLANIVFDNRSPVRCLKDGRLLFVSREIRLPSSVNATPAAALFSLDSNREETVVRRSEDIVYFEPSPDNEQLAVTWGGGGGLLVCKTNGSDQVE